jgi:predicted transcriptional regulator
VIATSLEPPEDPAFAPHKIGGYILPRLSNRTGAFVKKGSRSAAGTPRLQDTVRLSADGLAKVLGDLEARVMRAVWDIGRPASARVVHARVARRHDVALLTVITVLNKLVEKGLLTRAKRDDLLHFEARWSEEEFMAHASRRVVEGVLSFGPDVMATSFVDVLAERDPEKLAELGRLIRRRLREQEKK